MSMNRIIGAVMSLYRDAQVGEDAWTTEQLRARLAPIVADMTRPVRPSPPVPAALRCPRCGSTVKPYTGECMCLK